jgi:hypothetical protein
MIHDARCYLYILYLASCNLYLLSVSCFGFRIFDQNNGVFGQALVMSCSITILSQKVDLEKNRDFYIDDGKKYSTLMAKHEK